jgi:hypothetical protein
MLGSSSNTVLATVGFAPVKTEKHTVYSIYFFKNIEIKDNLKSTRILTTMSKTNLKFYHHKKCRKLVT